MMNIARRVVCVCVCARGGVRRGVHRARAGGRVEEPPFGEGEARGHRERELLTSACAEHERLGRVARRLRRDACAHAHRRRWRGRRSRQGVSREFGWVKGIRMGQRNSDG
eukprot:6212281-Pleurochrysis_carterae.AAC.3